jgi:hypothetical protein
MGHLPHLLDQPLLSLNVAADLVERRNRPAKDQLGAG